MSDIIIGWDIGGAHLKSVLVDVGAKRIAAYQQPCELWKGLDQLENACRQILRQLPPKVNQHVVTMTGELTDLFANRDDGVAQILAAIQRLLAPGQIAVYAGKDGFLAPESIRPTHYASIASANWLASATLAAAKVNNGLFIDIGSTTTDILLLQNTKVGNAGYSDYERLISQELVYTGVVRTPVMAVAQFADDQDKKVGLMAEYFATMADVYRLTGELDERHDQTPTADGAPKTQAASAIRLARMIGCDFEKNELPRWRKFAEGLRESQLVMLQHACERQLAYTDINNQAPVVGAGVGRFLVRELAKRLNRPYLDFARLFDEFECADDYNAADCAPAAAVAIMYQTVVSG